MSTIIHELQESEKVKFLFVGAFSVVAVSAGYALTVLVSNSAYVAQFGLAQFLFGGAGLGVGIWLGAIAANRGVRALLTPLAAMLLGFEMFIFAGPLLLPDWAPELYSNPDRIARAWVVTILGLSGYLLGYGLGFNGHNTRVHKPASSFFYRRLQIHRLFWIGSLLSIYRLIFFRTWYTQSGAGDEFLQAGPFATNLEGGYWFWGWWIENIAGAVVAVCLARAIFAHEPFPRYLRILGCFLLVVTFYSSLIEGNRGRFMMPILSVVVTVILLLRNRKQGSFSTRLVSPLVAVSLVTVLVVGIFFQTQFRTIPLSDALSNIAEGNTSVSRSSLVESGGDMLIYLDRILDEFGTVTPFWFGVSYVAPFTMLVPRQVWPAKPVGVAAYLDNAGPTIVGEWYANFSWFGVFVGMAVWGFLLRRWFSFCLDRRESDLAIMLYALSFGPLIYQVRGDFNTVISYWLYSSLLLLGVWMTSTKKQPAKASIP